MDQACSIDRKNRADGAARELLRLSAHAIDGVRQRVASGDHLENGILEL
jgi:hypothetical protein